MNLTTLKTSCIASLALGFALSVAACDSSTKEDGAGGQGGAGGAESGTTGGAAGGSSEDGADEETVTEWRGAAPHLELSGFVSTKAIDFSLAGADAADIANLYCERNYVVPDPEDSATFSEGYLEKVEVKYNLIFEGKLAEFQLEIEAEDIASLVGETFAIGDNGAVGAKLKLNPDEANEEEFEDAAASGSVTVALLSGTPGEDGVVIPDGTGQIGFFVDLTLESGKRLVGSFTANCGDNDLEAAE